MRHPAPVFGWVAVVVVLAVAMPAGAQERQALGWIRAAGVATSEASRKIVSSLRALIAEFWAFAARFGRVAAASGLAATPTASVVFRSDFDNDGRADVGVYRPGTAQWLIRRSSDGALFQVGRGSPALGDVPVPANYVGDGRSDIAIYRTTTGQWFIRSSDDATLTVVSWGSPPLGDVPLTRRP